MDAFTAWLNTWERDTGIASSESFVSSCAEVLLREGILLTPCLSHFWVSCGPGLVVAREDYEREVSSAAAAGSGGGGVGHSSFFPRTPLPCAPCSCPVSHCSSQPLTSLEEGSSSGAVGGAAGSEKVSELPPRSLVSHGLSHPHCLLSQGEILLPNYVSELLWAEKGGASSSSQVTRNSFWDNAVSLIPAAASTALFKSIPKPSLQASRALSKALPGMLSAVAGLAMRGVEIHAGSDALAPGCTPGSSFFSELLLLKACGLSDEEVLCAATVLPGAYIATSGAFAQLNGDCEDTKGGSGSEGLTSPPIVFSSPLQTLHSSAANITSLSSASLLPPPLSDVEECSNADTSGEGSTPLRESVSQRPPFASPFSLQTLKTSRLAWLGFIVEGGFADIAISRVDPRGDLVGALDSLVAVVVAGKVFYVEDLTEKLEEEWKTKDDNLSSQISSTLAPFLNWTKL